MSINTQTNPLPYFQIPQTNLSEYENAECPICYVVLYDPQQIGPPDVWAHTDGGEKHAIHGTCAKTCAKTAAQVQQISKCPSCQRSVDTGKLISWKDHVIVEALTPSLGEVTIGIAIVAITAGLVAQTPTEALATSFIVGASIIGLTTGFKLTNAIVQNNQLMWAIPLIVLPGIMILGGALTLDISKNTKHLSLKEFVQKDAAKFTSMTSMVSGSAAYIGLVLASLYKFKNLGCELIREILD